MKRILLAFLVSTMLNPLPEFCCSTNAQTRPTTKVQTKNTPESDAITTDSIESEIEELEFSIRKNAFMKQGLVELKNGQQALKNQDWSSAILSFSSARNYLPNTGSTRNYYRKASTGIADAYYHMALTLMKAKNYNEAEKCLREARGYVDSSVPLYQKIETALNQTRVLSAKSTQTKTESAETKGKTTRSPGPLQPAQTKTETTEDQGKTTRSLTPSRPTRPIPSVDYYALAKKRRLDATSGIVFLGEEVYTARIPIESKPGNQTVEIITIHPRILEEAISYYKTALQTIPSNSPQIASIKEDILFCEKALRIVDAALKNKPMEQLAGEIIPGYSTDEAKIILNKEVTFDPLTLLVSTDVMNRIRKRYEEKRRNNP